jgi:hypothetical protein
MKNFLLMMVVMLLTAKFVFGAAFFDPRGISITKSTWQETSDEDGREYYYDFTYNQRVIFRVLERFLPALHCLLEEAKRGKGKLKEPAKVFFKSAGEISENFSIVVVPEAPEDNIVTISPESLSFHTEEAVFNKSYYIEMVDDPCGYEINKSMYGSLLLAKTMAIHGKASLRLNLSQLIKPNAKPENCVAVVPIITNEIQCAVCQEHAKEILLEPCNHVCLCDSCSEKVKDECPLCRQKIRSRKKVFL